MYHGCLLHGDGTEPLPPHSQAFLYPQGVAVFSGVTVRGMGLGAPCVAVTSPLLACDWQNMEMLREGVRAVLAFVQPYLM